MLKRKFKLVVWIQLKNIDSCIFFRWFWKQLAFRKFKVILSSFGDEISFRGENKKNIEIKKINRFTVDSKSLCDKKI